MAQVSRTPGSSHPRQRELDSASGSRLAFIIEQLTDPADRDQFLAIANDSLGTLAGHDVVTKTAGGIQDHVTALTEPVRGQDVRLGFEDYELRRLARGLRLKMAEHGIEPADLTESGLATPTCCSSPRSSWSSGTPTMPS